MDEVDAMITFGAVDHWTLPPDRRRRDDFERPRPGDGMGDLDFGSVERSRNVIMLSGVLDIEDLERLGINIGSRSWIGSSRSARSHSLGGVPQHLLWTGWPFPRKRC